MIKVRFQDTSFRDGFQSVFGARVLTKDFLPAVEASLEAGINHFEAGGGARFQSLFFYCNESAFDMMDAFREVAGKEANLQTLARGINVVALSQAPRDMIDLHAKLFKKHGITTIRNFDALNDIQNLQYSAERITKHGLHHQICITMMDLPPGSSGAHDPDFYTERLQQILDSGVPFDSICYKDASGSSHPRKVYETLKQARSILGDDQLMWFHTHDTAGTGISCYMAALEAAATKDNNMGICLAKSPVSGGTSQPDILSMWHALKNTEWTIDIDVFKILKASEVFQDCMKDYFIPPEATKVSPTIPLSPMPGGALTANTMMMRDSGTLHLYPDVIREMGEVVQRGGFATSVTPVSQFYFQQAFANVTQGKWKKITDGYGNMVLGYFGKTPVAPDKEIVSIAAKQLKKEPFTGNPIDILEDGIPKTKKVLEENGLETTEENIFIAYACGEKGIQFLKGNMKENIRKISNEVEPAKQQEKELSKLPARYTVTVNGQSYDVQIDEAGKASAAPAPAAAAPAPMAPTPAPAAAAPAPAAPAAAAAGEPVPSAMPGTIIRISVSVGDTVEEGDELLTVEAMKMESPVMAPRSGTIASVDVSAGDNVKAGDTLVTIS